MRGMSTYRDARTLGDDNGERVEHTMEVAAHRTALSIKGTHFSLRRSVSLRPAEVRHWPNEL